MPRLQYMSVLTSRIYFIRLYIDLSLNVTENECVAYLDTYMNKAPVPLETASRLMTSIGNTLAAVGCAGLVLGMIGAFDMETVAFGLSSGVRIIGTVAIGGCLLSAIGYGISDYIINK